MVLSRAFKGGTDPVKSVSMGYGTVYIDGVPIARSTSPHMVKAYAEYLAWTYNLEGYTDAIDGFVPARGFRHKKYWPKHHKR